jgi:hypothetical protein
MVTNPAYRSRTRYIDVYYHYVREAVENGLVKLKHVGTKNMLADVLTKPLAKGEYARFIILISLRNYDVEDFD